MSHDDNEHLDNLSKEALIADLLPLLHHGLDLLPNPLFAGWSCACGRDGLFAEESVDKLHDELWLEQIVKLSLVTRTRESKRHEGKLEHVVLCLVGRLRCHDLLQSGVHDVLLSRSRGVLGDVDGAESHKGLQVKLDLAEEVLKQVEEDLGVGTLVLAVDNQRLLNLHVDLTSHLGS